MIGENKREIEIPERQEIHRESGDSWQPIPAPRPPQSIDPSLGDILQCRGSGAPATCFGCGFWIVQGHVSDIIQARAARSTGSARNRAEFLALLVLLMVPSLQSRLCSAASGSWRFICPSFTRFPKMTHGGE